MFNAPSMTTTAHLSAQECFAHYGNKQILPRGIPLREIQKIIDREYDTILERFKTLFANTNQARALQQNRGRLATLVQKLKIELGIPEKGDCTEIVETFGELRNVAKKAKAILSGGRNKSGKKNVEDPTAIYLANQSFDEIRSRYIEEINGLLGQEPDTDPTPQVMEELDDVRKTPLKPDQTRVETPQRIQPRSFYAPNVITKPVKPDGKFELESLDPDFKKWQPSDILLFLDKVANATWGIEHAERSLLENLSIPWNTYRLWRQDSKQYEHAAEVLAYVTEHGTIPPERRIFGEVLKLVLNTLEKNAQSHSDFIARLHAVGLYQRHWAMTRPKVSRGIPSHEIREVHQVQEVEPPVEDDTVQVETLEVTAQTTPDEIPEIKIDASHVPEEDPLLALIRARGQLIDFILQQSPNPK